MRWPPLIAFFNTGDVFALSQALRSTTRATIVPTVLPSGAGASTTDGTSFASSSVTPVANRLTLLAVSTSHGTTAETPSSVTGNGLTWTAVTNGAASTTGATSRTSWFYTWGAAPSAGAVTMNFSGTMTGAAWAIISCQGAVLAAPRQATSNTANSTTVTGTLAALENASNMHIYAVCHVAQEAAAPPAAGNWAELADHATTSWATPARAMQVAYAIGDVTADPTWTTSSQAVIVSLEVKAA